MVEPESFRPLFASMSIGDELTLHKGPGAGHWKIEVSRVIPQGPLVPIPESLWSLALTSLADDWQGKVRFLWEGREWQAQIRASATTVVER